MSTEEYQQRLEQFLQIEKCLRRIPLDQYERLEAHLPLDCHASSSDKLKIQMLIREAGFITISRETGIPRRNLLNWIRGRCRPNKANRQRLIEYFGCDAGDL